VPSFGPLGGGVPLPGDAHVPPCGLLMLRGGLCRELLPRLALSLSSSSPSPSSSPEGDGEDCEVPIAGVGTSKMMSFLFHRTI
jgi:hypothetical protein